MMGEFIDAALAFPTVLLTVPLIVTVVYWIVVLAGGADIDGLDGPGGGFVAGLGVGGVPVAVAGSLLIAVAWFASLVGTELVGRLALPGALVVLLGFLVLSLAFGVGWVATRVLVSPLRRLFADAGDLSRSHFVGRLCVIRTARVGPDFGQAEVTAADGSSAVVQVRQSAESAAAERLHAGSSALIFDFDEAGEFFWVMPADPALNPPFPTPGQRDH